MEHKDKNLTSAIKKISTSIESGRKNIEADTDLVQNLNSVKTSFAEMDSVIKSQGPALDNMKRFSKEIASESSKNLEVKRFFHGYIDRARTEFKQYFEVIK